MLLNMVERLALWTSAGSCWVVGMDARSISESTSSDTFRRKDLKYEVKTVLNKYIKNMSGPCYIKIHMTENLC